MIRMKLSDIDGVLTDQEIQELHMADALPIEYDEDSPEMSLEMLKQFHRFDAVPVRVTQEMIQKAKTYDKDYISFFSRLLALALNDNEMLKKCV